jgi:hypothetical protein
MMAEEIPRWERIKELICRMKDVDEKVNQTVVFIHKLILGSIWTSAEL